MILYAKKKQNKKKKQQLYNNIKQPCYHVTLLL